jgi:hypothetical protein
MPNERRLRELTALAQIYQGQQEQQSAVQAQKMHAALQILNMQQQQQAAAQREALDRAQLEQAGRRDQMNLQSDVLRGIQDPTLAAEYSSGIDPAFGAAQGRVKERQTQQGIGQLNSILAPLYAQHGNNVPKLQELLGAIQPTQQPDVWNGANWDQLNQGLSPVSGGAGASVLRAPNVAGPSVLEAALQGLGRSYVQTQGAVTGTNNPTINSGLKDLITYPYRWLQYARGNPAQ